MKMDMITCKVRLNGDPRAVQVILPSRPITYAELILLEYVHGPRNVTDQTVVDRVDMPSADEKQRLYDKYGDAVINKIYPANRFKIPGDAPPEFARVGKAVRAETRQAPAYEPDGEAGPDETDEDMQASGRSGRPRGRPRANAA